MTLKRYLVLTILATTLLAGCGGGGSQPTARPFARYTAQEVLNVLNEAGLSVARPQRDLVVGRGAPMTYSDRYTFEIDIREIAPSGGQVVVFASAGAMKTWQDYIASQRTDSATRRDWLFVFTKANALVQVNADLTNAEADKYRLALEKLP